MKWIRHSPPPPTSLYWPIIQNYQQEPPASQALGMLQGRGPSSTFADSHSNNQINMHQLRGNDALEEDKVSRGDRGVRGGVAIVYRWSLTKWCLRLWRCQRRKLWISEEDPLEEEMATHSSILAGKIPQTEETAELQSMGSQRVGHNWATEHARAHVRSHTHTHTHTHTREISYMRIGKSKCKGPEAAVLGQFEDKPGHWCGWSRVGPGERGEVGREVSQVEGSRVCGCGWTCGKAG